MVLGCEAPYLSLEQAVVAWSSPPVWFVDFMVFRTRGHDPRNHVSCRECRCLSSIPRLVLVLHTGLQTTHTGAGGHDLFWVIERHVNTYPKLNAVCQTGQRRFSFLL